MASNEIETLDPVASVEKLKKIAAGRALNRRRFITALGMTGAAAGAGLVSGCSSATTAAPATTTSTTSTPGQSGALSFLLNLKFLQATFYSYITLGADINSASTQVSLQGSGAITGAPGLLTFTGTNAAQITDLLNEIYFDEWNHVATLQSILGSTVISRPAINLAFAGAVTATNALSIARLIEDLSVTAFNGVTSVLSTSNVTLAAQILGTDSFHAGALRLVSIQNPTIAAYDKADSLDVAPIDPGSALLAAQGPTGNGGFFATAGAITSNTTTLPGFAFSRTTSQVLAALYATTLGVPAASGTAKGGAFPSGVNGVINTV
jgi:hypothetical protein